MNFHRPTFHWLFVLNLAALCTVLVGALPQEPFGFNENMDESCKEMICNDPLNVLTSDKRELSSVTSKSDMDRLCPDIKQHLDCIDKNTKRCMTPESQMIFNVLYNGTIVVMTELCHNDTYQQEFLKYARCSKDMKEEEDCEAKYLETLQEIKENSQSHDAGHRICCSFQTYLECSKRTAIAVCGQESGEFNRQMLDTMSNSLKKQCQHVSVAADMCQALSLASRTPGGRSTWLQPHLLMVALPALLAALLPLQQLGASAMLLSRAGRT